MKLGNFKDFLKGLGVMKDGQITNDELRVKHSSILYWLGFALSILIWRGMFFILDHVIKYGGSK